MWGGARACRVCLAGQGAGAGLRPARPALQRAYQQAAGLPFQEECGMPRQLCYECAALLIKLNVFREKCHRSHLLLQAIYDAHDQITDEEIAKIDREASKLSSPHTISNVVSVSFDPFLTIEVTVVKNESVEQRVKQEVENGASLSSSQDVPDIHDGDASMKLELVKVKCDKEKKTRTLKKPMAPKKPVAPRKKRKITRKKKVTVSPKKTVGTEESVVTEGSLPEDEKRPEIKSKIKYPKSFYEEFATVTDLTREQQLEEIQKRQETSNYKNSPLKCTLCFKGFLEESTFKNHMAKHDLASGDFECDICRRRFKLSHILKRHVAASHMHRYACKQCVHVSSSPTQARLHEKWHKGTSYQCPHCDDSFLMFTSYMGHLRKKHPSQFVCELCGNAFVSKKGIMQHKNLAHRAELPSTEGPLCSECDIRFASEDAYKKHLLTSAKHNLTNDCLLACDDCGQKFQTRLKLRYHIYQVHGRVLAHSWRSGQPRAAPADKNYPRKCDQCPVEVTCGRDYWVHFRRAHRDQEYPKQAGKFTCEVCGRGFQMKALLVYHHRQHSGEKPYKCTVCNRGFRLNASLMSHMHTHTGDRPFVCSVCGKGFQTKGNLNRHVRIHTGDKSYPCDYCEKKFCSPSDLKTHFTHSHLKVPWPKKKNRGSRSRKTTSEILSDN